MAQIVIDASVFMQLLLSEAYSEQAHALREAYLSRKFGIAVPSLFAYEVLNAARYSKAYSVGELESLSEAVEWYRFEVHNVDTDFSKAIARAAMKYNLSVYDAAYVVLAQATGSVLYTADTEIIDKVKGPHVRHIKDFK